MKRLGVDLTDVQPQADPNRRPRRMFQLGAGVRRTKRPQLAASRLLQKKPSSTAWPHAGGRAYAAKAASTLALRAGSSGPASTATTHSRTSARFLQPSTTVSTASMDSA